MLQTISPGPPGETPSSYHLLVKGGLTVVLESICLPVAHGHASPCVTDPETSHLKAIMASSSFSHSRKRPGRDVLLPWLWLNSDKPQGFVPISRQNLWGHLRENGNWPTRIKRQQYRRMARDHLGRGDILVTIFQTSDHKSRCGLTGPRPGLASPKTGSAAHFAACPSAFRDRSPRIGRLLQGQSDGVLWRLGHPRPGRPARPTILSLMSLSFLGAIDPSPYGPCPLCLPIRSTFSTLRVLTGLWTGYLPCGKSYVSST